MRTINHPLYTQSKTLTTKHQVIPSQTLPNFGPVEGFYLSLTVTIAGGTASQSSNPILDVIERLQIKDAFGKVAMDAYDVDLSFLLDMLSPRGVRVASPVVATDGGGDGTATWQAFLPFTISAKDMPSVMDLTFAAISALENGSLTSAGTCTVTFDVRIAYATDSDRNTLRLDIGVPPHQQGRNSLGSFLPAGMALVGFAIKLAADANFDRLTVTHQGVLMDNAATIEQYQEADTELMQSGHLSGQILTRYPAFVVDSTSTVELVLVTDSAIRLFNLSTAPQQRGAN
jgi:hypothetical protein